MISTRTPRPLTVALAAMGFVLFAFAGSASAGTGDEPLFVPAPNSPLRTPGSPVGVDAMDVGGREESLVVLNRKPGSLQVFDNPYSRPLVPATRFRLNRDPLSLEFQTELLRGVSRSILFEDGSYSFFRLSEDQSIYSMDRIPAFNAPVGDSTSSARLITSILGENPLSEVWGAIVDRDLETFSLVSRGIGGPDKVEFSAKVGKNPVASYTNSPFAFWVVNKGSDSVSLIQLVASETPTEPGHYELTDTVAVGDQPVAIEPVNDNGNGPMAVINSGSDDVSIIGWNAPGPPTEIQRIEVGDRPVAATRFEPEPDATPNLAVANFDSDDLTVLEPRQNGQFRPIDTIRVGDQPIDIAAGAFDPYFGDDLATAHPRDDEVVVLIDNEASGSCRGTAAIAEDGTRQIDELPGTRNPDQIHGFGGSDWIRGGRDGHDCLFGGTGDDSIEGYGRGDAIFGGPGKDSVIGGPGSDLVRGGPGDDVICEHLEENRCRFSAPYVHPELPSRDRLHGGAGNDMIQADIKSDVVSGGSGNDFIVVRDGWSDKVDCGPGIDRVLADTRDVLRRCERIKRKRVERQEVA